MRLPAAPRTLPLLAATLLAAACAAKGGAIAADPTLNTTKLPTSPSYAGSVPYVVVMPPAAASTAPAASTAATPSATAAAPASGAIAPSKYQGI